MISLFGEFNINSQSTPKKVEHLPDQARFILGIMLSLMMSAAIFIGYIFYIVSAFLIIPIRVIELKENDSELLYELVNFLILKKGCTPIFVILYIASFIQSSIFFIFWKESIINISLWTLITSLMLSFIYLCVKEMSGGGSKVEEKKSLLSGLFQNQKTLAN